MGYCSEIYEVDQLRFDKANLNFKVETIKVESRPLLFLNDLRGIPNCLQVVIAFYSRRKELLISKDSGASWDSVFSLESRYGNIVRAIATESGVFVFQTTIKGCVGVYHESFGLRIFSDSCNYLWHGHQGASVGFDMSVMFAEYQTGDEREQPDLNVIRVAEPYTSLQKVFSRKAGVYPAGDIRHFHTCVADPFVPNRWFLSSGDVKEHNKVWISNDDGRNWRLSQPNYLNSSDYNVSCSSRILRFTSLSITEDRIIWATDDNIGIGSSVIASTSSKEPFKEVRIESLLTKNLARNIIKYNNSFLVVTEAKSDIESAQMHLVGPVGDLVESVSITNLKNSGCGTTLSLASSTAVSGLFFIPARGSLFTTEKAGLLRLSNSDI